MLSGNINIVIWNSGRITICITDGKTHWNSQNFVSPKRARKYLDSLLVDYTLLETSKYDYDVLMALTENK